MSVFTLAGFSQGQVKVNDHAQVNTRVPSYVPPVIGQGPQVLIVHTHTTESYANDGSRFLAAAAFSQKGEQNMVAVGDVFEQVLTRAGIGVVHSHRIHDADYRHAYEASLETVEYFLEKYPSIRVVLDIHRDSVEDAQGQQAALMGTQEAAQIMFVVGTDGYGKEHPQWTLNLGFAYAWQEKLGEEYPTLCRPIHVSKNRYNQHVRAGALIVEVGTEANTQSQAVNAARLAAQGLVQLLAQEGTQP
ncbi:MAG: stage II sporulation protein P [Clostridia bacterium]|nr:stage II sporulation protein P [Clostridia bacterium]